MGKIKKGIIHVHRATCYQMFLFYEHGHKHNRVMNDFMVVLLCMIKGFSFSLLCKDHERLCRSMENFIEEYGYGLYCLKKCSYFGECNLKFRGI